MLLSAVVRAILAYSFCLGNDEAYYYTYALYPDLSHFDHPPMVGWVISLFTFNLHLDHEFFVRLGAVIAGTLNTWIIYLIGKQLGGQKAGLVSAVLYTTSVYGAIICGTMIMPDSPQSTFWLTALLYLLKALPEEAGSRLAGRHLLLASVFIGLGMLSKYNTIALWAGMMLYVVLYERKWLKTKELWISQLIILLLMLPVILWNAENGWVSFTFHGSRIGVQGAGFQFDSFLTELAGEMIYTNPVIFICIVLALYAAFTGKQYLKSQELRLLLLVSLPLVVVFPVIAFFRHTLPHWNGPGYLTLLPLAAIWLIKTGNQNKALAFSTGFMAVAMLVVVLQITTGFIPVRRWLPDRNNRAGENDISLELVGWRQLRSQILPLFKKYEQSGQMAAGVPIVSYRWFPAAHYDYYLARGTGRCTLAMGDTSEIHKYAWINALHGGFRLNTDAWYITSSRDFRHPSDMRNLYYQRILPPDTISIKRAGRPAYYFYVYRLKNLQSKR